MDTQKNVDIEAECNKEDISHWSTKEVHKWLVENGYKNLAVSWL